MTTPTPSPSEAMRPAEEQAWQRHLATMPEGARRNVMESAARGESETRKAHSSAYLAALKAKQIDVEAVMRLADEWVVEAIHAALAANTGHATLADPDTAREALRASLLGDGGTL